MPQDPHPAALAPLGAIEPHTPLLQQPPTGQLLYKVMSTENFLRSVEGNYLYFNRVDSYTDAATGDPHDGELLPGDRPGSDGARFAKAPDFSGSDYYDRCRARTYACCFSLQNSDHIWKTYGVGGAKGNVGLVFDFDKLRATLNRTLAPESAALDFNGVRCRQIFSVNYGIIEYVEWQSHRANLERLANPIQYTYFKDERLYADDNELRVSLSAIGIGHFVLTDGTLMEFPPSLHVPFDFKAAFGDGTITALLYGPTCDKEFLCAELGRLNADVREG